jgi:hypothetical protein
MAVVLLLCSTITAAAEATKKIKIGIVYDYSGPLAAGGSELHGLGTKIMIDYFNQHGGVEGYQIEPIYADAQSKPDVAINEAVRLISTRRSTSCSAFSHPLNAFRWQHGSTRRRHSCGLPLASPRPCWRTGT